MISEIANKIKYYYTLIFIFSFFPSFVLGVFATNLVCISFVLLNLFYNFKKIKKMISDYWQFVILFFLFYFILILSSLFSGDIFHSLQSSALYFIFCFYCLSIILLFIEDRKFIIYFFLIGLLTCLILSLDAIFELFNGHNIFGFSSVDGRIAGMFGNRWLIGRYFIYLLPIFVGIYFLEIKSLIKYKIFFYSTILLMSLIIIFSGERAAFIMFFIYLILIFLILLRKINTKKLFIFSAISLFLIIIPFLFSETSSRIQNNFILYLTNSDVEKNQYLAMFISAWKMFLDNPFFGVGPNNYRLFCSDSMYYVSKWSCSTHPHSITFQILAEVGIFGFLAIYSLFTYFALKCLKLILMQKLNYQSIGIFSINCSLLLYFFPFMITGNFFLSWYGFIFYLPIAIFLFYNNQSLKVN